MALFDASMFALFGAIAICFFARWLITVREKEFEKEEDEEEDIYDDTPLLVREEEEEEEEWK